MMSRLVLLGAVSFGALPALAQAGADYAYAWPLLLEGESPAWLLELTPEMVAASVDPGLRDVEVFDAAGVSMPLGPLPRGPIEFATVAVPSFAVARDVAADAAALRLRIEAVADGDAHVGATVHGGAPQEAPADRLVDLRSLEAPIDGLIFNWDAAMGDIRLQLRVEASDDLETWRTLVSAATLLQLAQRGEVLEKRVIELPLTKARYLRLRVQRGDAPSGLRIEARHGTARHAQPATRWVYAELRSYEVRHLDGEQKGVAVYDLPAPLRFEGARVEPSQGPSLARVQLQGLEGDRWLDRAAFPVVRMEWEGESFFVGDVEFPSTSGPTSWRLISSPPFPAPPRLELEYRPSRLVFLPQGQAPYVVAVGSQTQRRADAPTSAALQELRRRLGDTWDPAEASVGDRVVWRGEQALQPPVRWAAFGLWGVLLLGAAFVGVLALRLLRRPPEGA